MIYQSSGLVNRMILLIEKALKNIKVAEESKEYWNIVELELDKVVRENLSPPYEYKCKILGRYSSKDFHKTILKNEL